MDATIWKVYTYILKLRPDLLIDSAWIVQDETIVADHFNRLKVDTDKDKVILAGRTTNSGSTQFGIVIYKDKSWESAILYMNSDPVVKSGIMSATLFPFRVALMKF